MDATSFEFTLSLPNDDRFAATIRDLAIHAARYAGCARPEADAFGCAVEALLRRCFEDAASDLPLPIVVRRAAGPLEILIGERSIMLDV
jgi:hypothetical protein